jgi:putative membrane protein
MRSEPAPPPPPPPPPEVGPFVDPRRLHPVSVVLGLNLTQMIQAVLFPVAATFAINGQLTLAVLAVIAVAGLVFRVLAWQRFRFSFDGDVLRVDSGVLSRNHRSLDVARIQQVEIERSLLQRLLGLAAIRVETAGSASDPEVDLRVLPEADAVALRDAVRASKERLVGTSANDTDGQEPADGDGPGRTVLVVPLAHVMLAAVTGARLLVLPAVLGGAFQFVGQQVTQFVDRITDELVTRGVTTSPGELFTAPRWPVIATFAAAAVVLSVIAAALVGILRDGNFRIVRIADDLHISRGLLSTRDSVVPLQRIQLVEVERNWLRRVLGYATLRIRSAGGSTGASGRLTIPLVAEADIDSLLGDMLPGVDGVPPLRRHPGTALRRALFRWLRPAVLLAAALWLLTTQVPFLTLPFEGVLRWGVLALLPINAALAVIEYRQLAHGSSPLVVASRRGALSVTTTLAPVVKVQAVSSRRSLFQRRLGLATLVAHVAGPGARLEVLDAASEDTTELQARLTEHAASPTTS